MPNDSRDIRELWQTQEVEKVTITIDEIRHRAQRFERRIWWRNAREYIAGAIVMPVLLLQIRHAPGWDSVGVWLMIAGMAYVMFELHRRTAPRSIPEGPAAPSLRWYREELERQRDALRSVWLWYLLPFAPGLVAIMAIKALEHGVNAVWYICLAVFPLGFLAILKLNQAGARRLDRKIEEIRSMEEAAG